MSTEKPKRRPRYKGKNPRHFSEKYKEHAPERYAGAVAKVIASGKTPFHSGEDRRVKKSFQSGERRGDYSEVAHEVMRANSEELRANPRGRSAKLRLARRSAMDVRNSAEVEENSLDR